MALNYRFHGNFSVFYNENETWEGEGALGKTKKLPQQSLPAFLPPPKLQCVSSPGCASWIAGVSLAPRLSAVQTFSACKALQRCTVVFPLSEGPEETEEPVSSTPVVEGESEEPAGTEFQRDPEACQPAPDSATFPKIHSRRFRE